MRPPLQRLAAACDTQGVRVISLRADDAIADVARVVVDDEETVEEASEAA